MKNDEKDKKDEKNEPDLEEIKKGKHKHEAEEECECDHEKEELRQKVEDFENSYKRALADYQNLQKRVAEERVNWLKIANKDLLLRLLPVLDTLIMAHKHSGSEELNVGINQFIDALKTEGVTRIEVVGSMFDPQIMEALKVEKGDEGKVLEELRAGFMIHDKLLRPAQVTVGKEESKKT